MRTVRTSTAALALSLISVLLGPACARVGTIPAEHAAAGESPSQAPPPGDHRAPIRTDRRSYVASPHETHFLWVTIVSTYTNRTGAPVYIASISETPNQYALDRWIEGRWVQAYRPISVLDPGNPTVVPDGATHTDTLSISLRDLGRQLPIRVRQALGKPVPEAENVSGTYRLRYTFYHGWQSSDARGRLLAEEDRVSNPFTIRG